MAKPRFEGWVQVHRFGLLSRMPCTHTLQSITRADLPKLLVSRHKVSSYRLAQEVLAMKRNQLIIDDRLRVWKRTDEKTLYAHPRRLRLKSCSPLIQALRFGLPAIVSLVLATQVITASDQNRPAPNPAGARTQPHSQFGEGIPNSRPTATVPPTLTDSQVDRCGVITGADSANAGFDTSQELSVFGGVSVSITENGDSIQKVFFETGEGCWVPID